ncbi:adenylosuccinate synthetase [Confluentibacter flavum]|uniref:Adenylosuccinate synthetase n=1 Tax=Confluentibacter flavum TaxID=1909700 RepID=A0A2N3HPU5_9FLAO|nr:adenylosuccinate synthetase [Confluentibacter flavum]
MLTIYKLLIIQLPIGTPNPDDNKPLNFSEPFDVIVFLILPVLVIIFYILWRKNKNRKD